MGSDKVDDILAGVSPDARKDMLDSLVSRLLTDLSEADRKGLLQKMMLGPKENRHVASMVER